MKLKKGVNFGGYLSQCVHTKQHYDTFILEKDVETVAKLGFDHIRLPFDSELVLSSDGKFIESGFDYLTQMIEWCKKYNLNIVLDLHKAPGYDFNDAGNKEKNNLFNNAYCQKLFIELWNSISFRYGFYQNVAFELLNEVVESEVAENWNSLIKNTVEKIRSNAPTTPIIYGGIQWNSARTLKLLDKPIDENIIFTFHFYEPLIFTHQKASWVAGMSPTEDIFYPRSMAYYAEKSIPLGFKGKDTVDSAEDEGKSIFTEMVTEAVSAAENAGVSLYCGEYGVIDVAPVQDTLAWFKDFHECLDKYDIGHAVWSYKEMNFGIMESHYDPIRDELIKTMTK